MDLQGFEAIRTALDEADIAATVGPAPEGDENLPSVTVEVDRAVLPAEVVNTLGKAGLLHGDENHRRASNRGVSPEPALRPVLQGDTEHRTRITFEDTSWNNQYD